MNSQIINIDFTNKQLVIDDTVHVVDSGVIEQIKKCGLYIKNIDKNDITVRMCKYAVTQNGLALEFIPKMFHTTEVCVAAIKQNKFAKKFVQNKEVLVIFNQTSKYVVDINDTNDCDLELVKKNGLELKNIKNQTTEICMTAVQQDYDALQYVIN